MVIVKSVPKVDVFQGLTRSQVLELTGWVKPKAIAAGEEIFRERELPDGLYILTKGTVGVTKMSTEGKFRLATIEAPAFFGEMALLEGAERSAGIVAKSDVNVLFLPTDLFVTKLNASNLTALRIALNIGRMVCRRLRDSNKVVSNYTASAAVRMRVKKRQLLRG